MNRKELKKNN